MIDAEKIKNALKPLVEENRKRKAEEDKERRRKNEEDRNAILSQISKDLIVNLRPILNELATNARISAGELREAIKDAISVNIPDIKLPDYPEVKVPTPQVSVSVPEIKIPPITIPPLRMPDRMITELSSIDRKSPLPVRLMDEGGKPFIFTMPGSGKMDFFTIKAIQASAWADVLDGDGRIKVSTNDASGLTDTELRASSVPVTQVSGAVWSTYLTGSNGTIAANIIDSGGVAYSGDNPLPITAGNSLLVNQLSGANWSVSVVDIFGSAASVLNSDNRIKVSVETGSSGLTDTELRASSVPVEQVSGSIWSTNVISIFGSTATDIVNPDGRLKVEIPTGSSGLTDTELRASGVPVAQVSGSEWSTYVRPQAIGLNETTNDVLRVCLMTDNTLSAVVNPRATGLNEVTNDVLRVAMMTEVVSSVASAGVGLNENTNDILKTYLVSSCNVSVAARSQAVGTNENTDDVLKVYQVSACVNSVYVIGSSGTTAVVGDIIADAADTEGAPIKIGGIARQANPTAVAAGDRVSASFDDIGRQVMRPLQVRDLIKTAYATLTSGSAYGTETTLLASGAGKILDLIYMMGTNDSDAAVTIDFRASTAGTVLAKLRIPANGTAGVALSVPIPGPWADHTWTIDGEDITGTNVAITALFSEEV